jgi:hypothetical protein
VTPISAPNDALFSKVSIDPKSGINFRVRGSNAFLRVRVPTVRRRGPLLIVSDNGTERVNRAVLRFTHEAPNE